jgi:D-beta-D-heptose 7-phosphate kinase/D-beta-D-heptose 1-phosphate adenosyltransferase
LLKDINSDLVAQQQLPTIAKLRVISRHQQVVRLDVQEQFSSEYCTLLTENFLHAISHYNISLIDKPYCLKQSLS